jgi:hypothetical protein
MTSQRQASSPSPFEDDASAWLTASGYRIDERNVASRHVELVCRERQTLVHLVEAEVDAEAVRALAEQRRRGRLRTGLLVGSRRISPLARKETTRHRDVACSTLDELIERTLNVEEYFTLLDRLISAAGILGRYVSLACFREEYDPATGAETVVERRSLDEYIDQWIDDPTTEQVAILGEFGTGKTWFSLNYAAQSVARYRNAMKANMRRPRIPLLVPLRDVDGSFDSETLVDGFLAGKQGLRFPIPQGFDVLNRMGRLLIILDGFDEISPRADRETAQKNFDQIASLAVPGAKVLLTCRAEYFRYDREGKAMFSGESGTVSPRPPRFEVVQFSRLDDDKIGAILQSKRGGVPGGPDALEVVTRNRRLLDLARRPLLLDLVTEALQQKPQLGQASATVDAVLVYLHACRAKLDRDLHTGRTFSSTADKVFFLCELSWEMLRTENSSCLCRNFRQGFTTTSQRAWRGHRSMLGGT